MLKCNKKLKMLILKEKMPLMADDKFLRTTGTGRCFRSAFMGSITAIG